MFNVRKVSNNILILFKFLVFYKYMYIKSVIDLFDNCCLFMLFYNSSGSYFWC